MNELIFSWRTRPRADTQRVLGESIFTEADTQETLREQIRGAVRCQFENDKVSRVIRLHFVREEVIPA